MATEYKYLGLGLAGGMGITALLIFGLLLLGSGFSLVPPAAAETQKPATSTQSPATPPSTATYTPTSLPSITPYPTIVLSSTPTLTQIELMLASGQLIFAGALPAYQQIQLYEASLKYIALTPQDGLQMAKQINGVAYGNAGNTCGPLAMAIMRDAGLVGPEVVPHDFWLLNPWLEDDRDFLNRTLPEDRYKYYVFHEWLKNFDWRSFPLLPGDFLYVHAGGSGNFDHMLVVNRVDSQLRAYSVTNYQRPDGFIIDEVLLYDPNDPNTGIFHAWTDRPFAQLGSTGFGGFEVWRPNPR